MVLGQSPASRRFRRRVNGFFAQKAQRLLLIERETRDLDMQREAERKGVGGDEFGAFDLTHIKTEALFLNAGVKSGV